MATTKNAASHLKASQLFMRTAFPLSILLSLFPVLTVVLSMFCRILYILCPLFRCAYYPVDRLCEVTSDALHHIGKTAVGSKARNGIHFVKYNLFCPYRTGPLL